MASGQFRKYVWDPVLIISQIMAMQSVFYFFVGLWIAVIDHATGSLTSLDQIFNYKELEFSSYNGRLILVAFVLNSLTGAGGLWVFIRRAKQCLDFAATAHFLHFICCWCYGGFPVSWHWWVINLICLTLTAVIGEFICMRTEMNAIPLLYVSKQSL